MRDRTRVLTDEVIEKKSDTDSIHLVTEVFYSAGGMNYSTYKVEPRGYYLLAKIVEMETGPRFSTERFTMFDGIRVKALVAPATRFSAKVLADLVPDPKLVADLTASVRAARETNLERRAVLAATEGT